LEGKTLSSIFDAIVLIDDNLHESDEMHRVIAAWVKLYKEVSK